MNQIATIRHFFGSRSRADCAMDAREYKRGGNPKNPGQFSSSGSGASSSAPKKESKPKTAKAEGSATPAKPRPKANVSEQAHAAAKAKVAENAAKPKKPAKPKAEKAAPKEKAPPKSKKPTQAERVTKLNEQYTGAMGAKPTRRRGGAESPVAPPAAEKAETPAPKAEASPAPKKAPTPKAEAPAPKAKKAKTKKQIAEEKRRAEFNEEYSKMMAAVPQQEKPTSHDVGHRVSFTMPAIVGNGKAIRATRGGIVQSIDNKGRLRVLDQTGSFHTLDPSEITSSSGAVPGEKERIQRLDSLTATTKAAPKKAPSPKAAAKPKSPSPKKYTGAKERTDTEKQELQMRSDFSTIEAAANAVPQQLADAKGYSPDWRGLLQTVRNMKASPHLGAVGMESIRKASRGIKPVGAGEPNAAERNALLTALKKTKASKPKAPKKPSVS